MSSTEMTTRGSYRGHIKRLRDDDYTPSFFSSHHMSVETLSGQQNSVDGVFSNQNLAQTVDGKWDVTPADRKVDDGTLLNIIESGDLGKAIKLLKEHHHFSQNGLDRALIASCRYGLKYLVQTLVHCGANVQSKDKYGNTPLLICAENGFIDILRFLLLRNADINAVNSDGDSALILSIKPSGSTEIVKFLLTQEGIDIIHQNRDGYTALMKAIEVMDVSSVKMLMDEYSNIKLKYWDNFGSFFNPGNRVHKMNAFNQAVTCNGESTQQIADRCQLGNVFQIFKTYKHKEELPLVIATSQHDVDSFDILLDCQFVDKKETKSSINEAFRKIFEDVKRRKVKAFDNIEMVMIRKLLLCGADVDSGWIDGPLPVSVEIGDYSLVELLCKYLDQQKQHRNGIESVALKVAATNGRFDLVELLMTYKADINKFSYSGSPLHLALTNSHFECAKRLIQIGAKMDIQCALESAVINQMPEYMNFLFDSCKQEIVNYAVKESGSLNNLLISAAERGNLDIIRHLLSAGADVNQGIVFGETAALLESESGDLTSRASQLSQLARRSSPVLNAVLGRYRYSIDSVQMLLENGACINGRSWDDKTPLMAAAVNEGSVTMLQILLDRGADFNAQDKLGNTALMEAVLESCSQNVSFLLDYGQANGLSLDVQNGNGLTALMWAVTCGDLKLVKQLVDHGADVNIKDDHGNTALLRAVTHFARSEEEVLINLINAGSDVNCQNTDGLSPLMIAAENSLKRPISLLLDSGADVNAVSENDNTKSALSFIPTTLHLGRNAILCMSALLERGGNSSYVNPGVLHKLIFQGEIDVIPMFIQCGLAPVDVKPCMVLPLTHNIDLFSTVSPLCMALFVGNASLAQDFVDNLFLTNSDVSTLMGNQELKRVLEKKRHPECVQFLREISVQPMNLFQLAFVTVSSAVGTSPGREDRVDMLPLPQMVKEKLLFKSIDLAASISTEEMKLNQVA